MTIYSNELVLHNAGVIFYFTGNDASNSLKFGEKITGQPCSNVKKGVRIMALFKYLSNFCQTIERSIINCENNLILTWSANCHII